MEGSDREFMIERLVGMPQGVCGPRCVLNANEEGRKNEWNSRKNHWHSGPCEWYYWCEAMFDDGNVPECEEPSGRVGISLDTDENSRGKDLKKLSDGGWWNRRSSEEVQTMLVGANDPRSSEDGGHDGKALLK